jgi:hypothetical protein
MNYRSAALAGCLIVLTGCANQPHRAEFSGGYPAYDCPDHLDGQVTLQAEVRPSDLQTASFHDPAIPTSGSIGRRLLISVTPSGLRPKDRIIWSALNVSTYGGTLLGWDKLDVGTSLGDRDQLATVGLSPGQLKITRIAKGRMDLTGNSSVDLLVMPGGVAIDDAIVQVPALWQNTNTPLRADVIAPRLVPVRHSPGLDVVQANLELNFVVQMGDTRDEWVCSAETRLTLVDVDSLRLPCWDLGLASSNSSRKEWLAMTDPALGAVRLVFENPASAHALASWLRTTRSTRVGNHDLAVFQQSGRLVGRPFGPVSADMMKTLRPLTDQDIERIAVGPAGEP